ncbi:MAG: tetratricopeptide repeat protein [Bacteroidetes bacterium]|nr:tetratricopeptide repeat protein [Bacteroidota bacterium]
MNKITLIFFILIAVFFYSSNLRSQSIADAMKQEALQEMSVGRFGEAIDLLNRYISAHPQQADGYNLRGECYEKRQQFENSVYDYRSARKLEPNNKEINANLARATSTWYSLLYNDIEGYKREIAINPNNPENYLSIGKAYKNLGQWPVAEEWYDKYLTMTHASPDEIIRYSEILAKNNHIAKGWPILKRYTEEYPNDQRLWSRFGYFSLWLGKTHIAIQAFESALALKPYFKEAMDGLDEARGKGYVYTVNDTSYKYFNYGLPPARAKFVYPIDKYYRIVKKVPNDNDTRFRLLKALIEANRFEEASQQIQYLQNAKYDSSEVAAISNQVDSLSNVIYKEKVITYKAKLAADSTDKDAVENLGLYYSRLQDYDTAIAVYSSYLNKYPNDTDILFRYVQAQADNRDYFKAQDKLQILLKKDPQNLKYQLFMGELDVWTGQNLDDAKNYLTNVLNKEPDNIAGLIAMSSLSMRNNNFVDAENYMDKIKTLNPGSSDLKSLQAAMTMNKFRYQQEQNYALLSQAETLYGEHNCQDALPLYEEFLASSAQNNLIEKEYADVNVCAGNYQKAIDIYADLLNQGYDFNIDVARATAYFVMGDSVNALANFQRLAKDSSDNFNVNLYLGDSYFRMHEYSKAEDVYDNMKEKMKLDSSQVAMIDQRYNWMPVTGFRGFLNTFPTYTLVTPYGSYYADNLGIKNSIQGLRIDLGITSFFSVGAEAFRTTLASDLAQVNTNTLRWDLTFRLAEALTFGVNFGNTYYSNTYSQPVADVYARSEVPNKYAIYGSYSKLDASQLIFSPYLIALRIDANTFRAGGYYQFKSGLKTSIDYSYMSFSDGNIGNTLAFRIGKYFYPDFLFGYEYYGSGFRKTSIVYFSPSSYSSHNITADWDVIKDSTSTVTIGGLIGFVSNTNFILRQAYGIATFRLADRFTLQGRISGGSSLQNYVGYSSWTIGLTAYWSL